MKYPSWKVLHTSQIKSLQSLIEALLKNREIDNKEAFFNPKSPEEFSLKDLNISPSHVLKAISRIKKAIKSKEKVIIYGDYDADGICATAILWESLYAHGVDVLPHIPNRFEEGYGINPESIKNLIKKHPDLNLIITVDNGITAHEAVEFAAKKNIDIIITDHHTPEKKKPKAHAIIHTTITSGSAVSWVFAREIKRAVKGNGANTLELAAIGTIADQLPLMGVNRSFVSHGLASLQKTTRPGLLEMLKEARVSPEVINTYHINYILAPRLNAMGRLKDGIDSLRLLCTKSGRRAKDLSEELAKTNHQRQKVVEDALVGLEEKIDLAQKSLVFLAHKDYHEGVIGLVASSVVQKYYRPAVVLSVGEKEAKASARSISGFNIIEAIRKLDEYLISGGGHPMAAGFTIKSTDVDKFGAKLIELSNELLTDEVLEKKLTIDMEINFGLIDWNLIDKIEKFKPFGVGNNIPIFYTKSAEVVSTGVVGKEGKHLKMKLTHSGREYDAIGFGFGHLISKISAGDNIDVAYGVERNVWKGRESLQLNLKDIKII